jgi:hypothetical protein
MDDNTESRERSVAEHRVYIDAKKNPKVIRDRWKARAINKDIDRLVPTPTTFNHLYVFFFQCQPCSCCFLLGTVISGQYRIPSLVLLRL